MNIDAPEPGAALSATELVIRAEDVLQLAKRTMEEIAESLEFSRLLVLSYSPHDGALRGVRAIGFEIPQLQELRVMLSSFSTAEQALRTRQIRPLSASGGGLPEALKSYFQGEMVVIPLISGERRLAVIVGQLKPGTVMRSGPWQERAEQVTVRATLLAEVVRLSAAYQDERRLRQATQAIIAAILEGRPLAELARMIVDQVSERLSEERAGLYLLDGHGQYRPAALRKISEEYAEGIARLRPHSPFTARAMATQLPYYTANAQSDPQVSPPLRALFERENIRSLLIAMLHHGDQIKGALVVYPQGERRFAPREITLFQALADQATLAVSIAQQLERQRDNATAEERNRLAREIHDTVAQSLAGVLMQVELAETYLNSGEYARVSAMLASARVESRKALEDTRRAVQGLAPPALEQLSLSEALTDETKQFAAEMGIEAPFLASGVEQPLTPDQSLALLRIAQEALNNARKHARAQRVRVGLQYGVESVILMVDDDGEGFNTSIRHAPDSVGGYGLFGMEERARLLGGEVQIDSTPGWGTRVRASLPYHPQREQAETRSHAPAPRLQTLTVQNRMDGEGGSPPIRVLIVDDHAIVRQGLRDILEAQGSVQVVGEAENGEQAAARAAELRPDVVLMDLQMPEVDGLEGLRRLHAKSPEMPVIVLTTFETEGSVAQALNAGARGYLLKDTNPEALVAAIHAVYRGESQFSSTITERLALLASGRAGGSGGDLQINDREHEVLELLARGARNKEIAAELFITVSTVEKHIANLFHKLEVTNRAEAARAAVDRGLLMTAAIPAASTRSTK